MISILLFSLAVTAAAPPDLVAVGIVLSPRGERSVAILRAAGRTRVVGVGDSAFGGRVTTIGRDAVSMEFAGGARDIRLAGAAAQAAAPPPDSPNAPETRAGERTFVRKEMERRLGEEIPRILSETTLLPVTSGGRVAGLTITRIPEGTLLTEAGLQSGDILTEINGTPIDSMATLIALWPRLQGESLIRAQVLRNGQPVSLGLVLR